MIALWTEAHTVPGAHPLYVAVARRCSIHIQGVNSSIRVCICACVNALATQYGGCVEAELVHHMVFPPQAYLLALISSFTAWYARFGGASFQH